MTNSAGIADAPAAAGTTCRPERVRYLRRDEASRYVESTWGLRCAVKTLAKMAVVGGGPRFRRSGRTPLYDPRDLDEWAESKLSRPVTSTSELREGT